MNDLRREFNQNVRNQYLKDKNICYCEKCNKHKHQTSLHVHHIISIADGGTNDYSNLIALCTRCHDEWHSVEGIAGITFNKWLISIPPYYALVKSLSDIIDKEKDITCDRLKLILNAEFTAYKAFGDSKEMDIKKSRQAEGIAIAKEKGAYKGRKKIEVDDTFKKVYDQWKAEEITAVKAMELTGLKRNTFYRRVSEYEENK